MEWLVYLYVSTYAYLYSLRDFNPKDIVDWFQLIYIPAGLLWIGYQFNRLRGRSDKEFDKWVEAQAKKMRRNLAEERKEYLDWLHDHNSAPLWMRAISATLAWLKLSFLFVLRILLLRRRTPTVRHAMTLWRAGFRGRAKKELEGLALDLESKLPTYIDLEEAKRFEARNAFLFAGRAAEEEGERTLSRAAFTKMLDLSKQRPQVPGDPDAHRLIAVQYLEANNTSDAKPHCDDVVNYAKSTSDELLEAEGYRLQARAAGIHTRDAKRLLDESLRIVRARENSRGLAETQELMGDIYRPRRRNQSTAARLYTESRKNYRLAGDRVGEDRVAGKINSLLGNENWLSRQLDRLSAAIARLATRMRDRP
jgi:hypothetical protein